MKTEITRPTWEDVVFESRNKEYGAYPIRKSYNENVSKASLIAFSLAAFVFGVLQVASLLRIEIKIAAPKIPIIGAVPPKIILDPPVIKQKIKSVQKTTSNFFPIATTQEVKETPPPVEPIDTSPVGDKTGTTEVPIGVTDQGSIVESASVSVKPREIFNGAEVMPQYEGGRQAMARFLSRNINYPASARSMGQEGTVYVRFVVNDVGQVVDVEIFTGVCALLDREAMRVVALMKKWKPGFQHDMPVNVRMVIPIRFELER